MDVRVFYSSLGVDPDEAGRRLGGDGMVVKYLRMFERDPSFQELSQAMAAEDWERTFRAVHTLKGVALNLSLATLAESCSALTEEVRKGDPDRERAVQLFERIGLDYHQIIDKIQELT